MKGLRNKTTGEWVHSIGQSGKIHTADIPHKVNDKMDTVGQIEENENLFRKEEEKVNLSDYELVEIEIIEKQELDKLVELAYAYKQLTRQ